MTRDERKKVRNFFLCLESNFTQMLFSNVGNFFILSRKFFSSRVKFYANLILKCRQFLFISSRNFFPSSQVNFYAKIILKCRQFFLSRVGNYFLCLESNFTQTLFWNVGNFFYLKLEFFSFVSSQILRKCYSQTSAIFFILSPKFFPSSRLEIEGKHFRLEIKKLPIFENNVCVTIDSRQRKTFLTWDKKLPIFENNVCVTFD